MIQYCSAFLVQSISFALYGICALEGTNKPTELNSTEMKAESARLMLIFSLFYLCCLNTLLKKRKPQPKVADGRGHPRRTDLQCTLVSHRVTGHT